MAAIVGKTEVCIRCHLIDYEPDHLTKVCNSCGAYLCDHLEQHECIWKVGELVTIENRWKHKYAPAMDIEARVVRVDMLNALEVERLRVRMLDSPIEVDIYPKQVKSTRRVS